VKTEVEIYSQTKHTVETRGLSRVIDGYTPMCS